MSRTPSKARLPARRVVIEPKPRIASGEPRRAKVPERVGHESSIREEIIGGRQTIGTFVIAERVPAPKLFVSSLRKKRTRPAPRSLVSELCRASVLQTPLCEIRTERRQQD